MAVHAAPVRDTLPARLQAADEAAGQVQPPGPHLQQPLCRRGVSPEAVQRILAARHAFVQQQRRQDRAVAGSAGKRFDPTSVSAVLYQSLGAAQFPAGRGI